MNAEILFTIIEDYSEKSKTGPGSHGIIKIPRYIGLVKEINDALGVGKDVLTGDRGGLSILLPLEYSGGCICDGQGNILIEANREPGKTPLTPKERDEILILVVKLLNAHF